MKYLILLSLLALTGCLGGPPFGDCADTHTCAADLLQASDASDGSSSDAAVPFMQEVPKDDGGSIQVPDASDGAVAPDVQVPGDDAGWCTASAYCGQTPIATPGQFCMIHPDGGAEVLSMPSACQTCGGYTCQCLTGAWAQTCSGGCSDPSVGFAIVKVTCQ